MLLVFAGLVSITSCVKDNFDEPPTGGQDPNIEVTYTIAQLKALWTGSNVYISDSNVVIKGIVVADDKTGNFYKTLIIQDSTGGIALRLDGTSLYTQYPIGRKVFIKCRGLWLGDYNNLLQLGGAVDNAGDVVEIPSAMFDQYILKGTWGNTVVPTNVTIDQLNANTALYQNTLIQLNGVEFASSDAGQPYADPVNQQSVNRTVKNCSNDNILVRTSGFSSFAGKTTPSGNGHLIAVFSVFGSDAQLLIRDPETDVKMDTTRCGGGVIGGSGIMGIRSYYSGSDVTLPANKFVEGIVISDKDNGNIDPKNCVIQDSTGGIIVRFQSAHSFTVGQRIRVDVSNQDLIEFNGLMEVDFVPNANATVLGSGSITPRQVTAADLNTNFEAWESTLVRIINASISGSGTYSGTNSISDGTGTVDLYTRSGASFSGSSLPAGTVSVTAIVSDFNGLQIMMRSSADVQ